MTKTGTREFRQPASVAPRAGASFVVRHFVGAWRKASGGKVKPMRDSSGANDPKASWSALELADLKYGAAVGRTSAEIAKLLGRPQAEVREKAAELGLKLAPK